MHNVAFVFLIVNTDFPSPESDYVLFILVPLFIQSSLPMKIIYLIKYVKSFVKKKLDAKKKKLEFEKELSEFEKEKDANVATDSDKAKITSNGDLNNKEDKDDINDPYHSSNFNLETRY